MVLTEGFEPPIPKAADFESAMYTSSIMSALTIIKMAESEGFEPSELLHPLP